MIRVTIVPIGWVGVNVKKSKHQRNRRRQFATMTLRNVVNYAAGDDEISAVMPKEFGSAAEEEFEYKESMKVVAA